MEVKLIDVMGNDLRVANAARVSFAKESELDYFDEIGNLVDKNYASEDDGHITNLKEADQKLIKYLAKHNHWTPFSHVMITMREKVPIFVARQRFKHMVGFTYNEISRRYVDDAPEFFTPDVWRSRPAGSVKQGSGSDHPDSTKWKDIYTIHCEHTIHTYETMINSGVAPEQARMILPQSMYTEYYVTGSLAAWARAYKLRIDAHAQKEIQDLAGMWNTEISKLTDLKYSWKALTE